MSDLRESARLRELIGDYYNQLISFEEYRAQRKAIFDIIDEEINGMTSMTDINDESKIKDKAPSLIHKAISFFKKEDIDKDTQ